MAEEIASMDTTEEQDENSFLAECRTHAEKGSTQHQLFLGKHFMKQARAQVHPEENGRKAVDWLIKASRQGDKEATSLLKECLENKTGINEDNLSEVKWCLDTSDLDKSVRIAAKNVFEELKPPCESEEEHVQFTQEIYQQRVKELYKDNKKERKFLLSTGRKLRSPDVVQEEDFVQTLSRRMRSGQIDPTKDDVEMEAFTQASMTRKLTKYPGTLIAMAVDQVVELLTRDVFSLLMTMIPFDQLNLLIIFFLFSMLSLTWLFRTMTLITFYLTFSVMVICTLQMFQNKRKQSEVKSMAQMLNQHSPGVDENEAESQFVWNSMRPYWIFWAALFVCIPSFFLANKDWIPCSEFALVSLGLCVACFVLLSDFKDPLVLFSLSLDILSTLPHLVAGLPKIPIIYPIFRFLTGSIASPEILPNIYLNVSIPSLGYLILPFLFLRLAMKNSWHGIYKGLIPHLVNFFWWQMVVVYYDNSTWLGLARGSLGWAAFTLLFPFITIGGMFYGAYYVVTTFSFRSVAKVVVTIILLLIPIIISVWQASGFMFGSFSLRGKSLRFKILAVVIPVILLSPAGLLFSGGEGEKSPEDKYLSWDLYKEFCSAPAWSETNVASAQTQCTQFRFMQVDWTGVVKEVTITGIENPANAFLDQLPPFISEWLKCIYGEAYPDCEEETMSDSDIAVCNLRLKYGRKCHMNKRNSYTFLLTISMPLENNDLQDISFKAGDEFKDILFPLKSGNQIRVQGTLTADPGSSAPQFSLKHATCLTCMMSLSEAHALETEPMEVASEVIMETFSFFSSPVLEYRKPKLTCIGDCGMSENNQESDI